MRSLCKFSLSAVLAMSAANTALAQVDTAIAHKQLFTGRDIALGALFTAATMAIRPLDKQTATLLQDSIPQHSRALRKAATGFRTIAVPGSVIIGVSMYATGRLANNDRLAELGLFGTEALFVGEGVGSVLKDFLGRARPYADSTPNPDNWQLMRGFHAGDKYRSFPSGHTVAGFAAAAAVSSEVSRWYPKAIWIVGPTMYGGASLIGLSRMYENRHWASDVIMGAAIGTFAGTKVVRFHRTHPSSDVDRWLLNASLNPADWSHISLSIVPLW